VKAPTVGTSSGKDDKALLSILDSRSQPVQLARHVKTGMVAAVFVLVTDAPTCNDASAVKRA
jgi:hypothetical protein